MGEISAVKQVSVLVDNDSWVLPYAQQLVAELRGRNIAAQLFRHQDDIVEGDFCFLLGCTRLVNNVNLAKNRHTLVVHASPLPGGRGFAPMSWQILAAQNSIPVCLLEAQNEVDSGDIWLRSEITLQGHELHSRWRYLLGQESLRLCLECLERYPHITPQPQQGEATYYPRRKPADSELDINKSLAEQFNLLRVVDNQSYPAFFYMEGKRYRLEIYDDE